MHPFSESQLAPTASPTWFKWMVNAFRFATWNVFINYLKKTVCP